MKKALVSPLRLEARTNTPLQPVRVHYRGTARRLWLKLELHNPTGSIKYRTAVGLLATLAADRPLAAGTRVVESTSGNLGLALARVLARFGCQLIAVIDPKVTPAVQEARVAEGAQLAPVHERDVHGGYLLSRLAKVEQLRRDDSTLRWTNQYGNLANPRIHRETIAAELVEQTAGKVDAVLAAVSTGGTLAGISEGMRAALPDVRVYAVDVHGSLVTSGSAGAHLLTGIGATRKSSFLHPGHYDCALKVFDIEAFAYCRMLADDTGLAVGGSGGAVLAAFSHLEASVAPAFRCPVAVLPDGARNYYSTFYDDGWLAGHGVLGQVRAMQARARASGLSFDIEALGNDRT